MPVEIACGNCGNAFGVEAGWAGLIVQCPHCQAAVQVPEEVAGYAEPSREDDQQSTATQASLAELQIDDQVTRSMGPELAGLAALTEEAHRPPPAVPPRRAANRDAARSLRQPPNGPTHPATGVGGRWKDDQEPTATQPPPTMGATPLTASSDRPVVDPLPPTTVPPVCAWMVDAASVGTPKIVVAQGLTTINYQGKRVVLRDQPEVARWYGLTVFLTSLVTLVALLIWLYFLYR